MKSSYTEIFLEIAGVALIASSVILTISLATYFPDDPSINGYLTDYQKVSNKAGVIGASMADTLAQFLGSSAWLLALSLAGAGIMLCYRPLFAHFFSFITGLAILGLALCGWLNITMEQDPIFANVTGGGALGALLAGTLVKWFSTYGSLVIIASMAVCAILVITKISLSTFTFRLLGAGIKFKDTGVVTGNRLWVFLGTLNARFDEWMYSQPEPQPDRLDEVHIFDEESMAAMAADLESEAANVERKDDITPLTQGASLAGPLIVDPTALDLENPPEQAPPLPPPLEPVKEPMNKASTAEPEEDFKQEAFTFKGDGTDYHFPDLSLLDATISHVAKQTRDELIKRSLILEKKLSDFGIEGRVTQVQPGPVITVYEFEPAPGIKVSRIANLADDLAMSLRAISVRVLAPIPGKSVVGIEAPNPSREMVYLKELLSSEEFERSSSSLTMALGKDVAGTPAMVDLASVPHLLIAGSTGSGKSVGINAMICSILYKASPADVKFIMIDPKMLELSIYEGIPHLIAPVVTNPKKAANALRWAVEEMERRYELLSELGVRNIAGYNRHVDRLRDRAKIKAFNMRGQETEEEEEQVPEKLPYIVVIIDELADLMMVASKEVEDSLARLAQMARAAGIHLIVATQRPSVDVLTGLIKANFPARISYQVRTRVDSRTILDSMGADTLLGKGDMLYLPAGASKLVRIHGPFVSDEEIHRVVDNLKENDQPVYNAKILEAREYEQEGEDIPIDDGSTDENYDKAVELVARTRQASISMIQRRLRIGYNRAARLVETMERQGLVGPADGLKPREVFLKELDDVETVN